MTIRDLIDELEGYDPETEVRFMSQQSWPFEYSIQPGIWTPERPTGGCDECGFPVEIIDDEHHHIDQTLDAEHEPATDSWQDAFAPHDAPEAGVVYLVEGTQLGYGTKDAWD